MSETEFIEELMESTGLGGDELAMVMGIIVAYAVILVIALFIGYIITSISYMGLCEANGHSKGAAWVPYYRKWLYGEFIGKANGFNPTLFSVWFCFGAFLSLIPAVGGIAISALGLLQYIFIIMAVYKARKAHGGNEALFMVLTILFPLLSGFFMPNVNFDEKEPEVVDTVEY